MDITYNERMRLAASTYRAYLQHAAQMELPLAEDATEDDILADLIAGLHHYADSRGIGFGSAVASGQAAYERHRAGEDNPYRIGDEIHLRQRPDTGFPSRGVVVSIFPERDGEPDRRGQRGCPVSASRRLGRKRALSAVRRQRIYSLRETVCNPRSRATMVHPIRGPDWLASLGPRHPGSGKWGDPIRIGSVQPGNGGPREVKGIYGNRRSLAWSRAKEPRPIG